MYPYKIENVEENVNKELMVQFEGERTGFCQVGPKEWLLPAAFAKHAENYFSMQVKEDDIWIITYPRSGTTLCQELVWLINHNLNYEASSTRPLQTRFPFLEFHILHHEEFEKEIIAINDNSAEVVAQVAEWHRPGYELVKDMESPRHIKSHLPFSLLPPSLTNTCKVIYVARNPKDVAVSYYHHNRLFKSHGYIGDFKQYWEYFTKNLLVYSPYLEHIKEGWERKDEHNVLFLFYENFIKDIRGTIKEVAQFLEKQLTPEQIERLVSHLHIDHFKKNVAIGPTIAIKGMRNSNAQDFIRRGQIGGNDELTNEINAQADKWIEQNLSDIKFPY